VRGPLAVEVLCGARGGKARCLVARLWSTPEPEPLRLNVDEISQWQLPRSLECVIPMGCASHDGNKGQQMVDLCALLAEPFAKYVRTGKKQTVTLPRPHTG
jgi:hypothetical protein